MYTVYKHESPSGKVYIGVTSQKPEVRWHSGHGYADNEYFTRAIKKYGWGNIKHEIIYTGLSKEEAELKEIELINLYRSNDREFGYNIENGGSLSGKHSEYTRLKISNSLKGENNPRYGKKFPNSKRNLSYESTLKRSLSHKNQIPVNKRAVCQYDKNGKLMAKFESMREAADKTGINIGNICRCVNGKRMSAGGYIWKFI